MLKAFALQGNMRQLRMVTVGRFSETQLVEQAEIQLVVYLTVTLPGGGSSEDVVKVRSPEAARLPAASLDLTR